MAADAAGEREVKKALRKTLLKYQLHQEPSSSTERIAISRCITEADCRAAVRLDEHGLHVIVEARTEVSAAVQAHGVMHARVDVEGSPPSTACAEAATEAAFWLG